MRQNSKNSQILNQGNQINIFHTFRDNLDNSILFLNLFYLEFSNSSIETV